MNKKNNDHVDIRKINIDKKNVAKTTKNKGKKVEKKEVKPKNEVKTKIEKQVVNEEVKSLPKKNTKKNYLVVILLTLLTLLFIFSISLNIINFTKHEKPKVITKYKVDENIVFFGDSITSIYDIDHFYPHNFVINSGVSGDKSEDLVERIDEDVYKYNPSKVFILIGINDLNHDIEEKEILKNIQKVVNGIKLNRKHAKIYIQSIYPINQDLLKENEYGFNEDLSNDDIIKINKKIKSLCKKNNIEYIDIYSMLTDSDGNLNQEYTKEGLHLNELGYMKLTEKLEKYVIK